ncbi:MAG: penicillin-binding protein 1C [bacterium]|nr:penicillin-binding protein 1C [bacterium]
MKISKPHIRRVAFVLVGVPIFSFLIYLVIPLEERRIVSDYSQIILASDSSVMRVFLNENEQICLHPSLQKQVPNHLKVAVINYEDQYFESHLGFNPVSLVRAIYLNLTENRIVSGGSTITMQVARMQSNYPRTYLNKIKEILRAIKIETRYSKEDILKEYLNNAPYGSNVRGYTAASFKYFGKKPSQLTWGEASTLAVLPNAPGIIFPTKNTSELEEKRNQLLKSLLLRDIIDSTTFELSILEPVPDEILSFDLLSPHLTDQIHLENDLDVIKTTIDAKLQRESEFLAKQHASRMKQMGINNLCALVVENKTGHIKSYVGSSDYFDRNNSGSVDGIKSSRSSGSILKPFLYALAIDDGIILPQSQIKDIPSYYNSFSPSNASENFQGIVPANEALIHSLNVPAVRLLNEYGIVKFYNALESAGVTSLFRTPDEYGLPIILGGAEVKPWDMAKLFRGMANGGEFGEIGYLPINEKNAKSKIISSGASQLVLDELQELIRPGLEFYWKKYSNKQPIAWKTGTSYGHKDAWAAGVTPDWTIIVWVGNFDGSSNNAISGMRSAGPLMFNILNVLEKQEKWFDMGSTNLTDVKICSKTGYYANSNCPEVELTKAPRYMKPLKSCPYHVKLFVDDEAKHQVCSKCWDSNHQSVTFLRYPSDVNHFIWKNGGLTAFEPPHNPNCFVKQENDILRIIYPISNATIKIPKDFDGKYQSLVAKVATRHINRKMYWYVDDSYLGNTERNHSFPILLKSGKHRLLVTDEIGNKHQVDFNVVLN